MCIWCHDCPPCMMNYGGFSVMLPPFLLPTKTLSATQTLLDKPEVLSIRCTSKMEKSSRRAVQAGQLSAGGSLLG